MQTRFPSLIDAISNTPLIRLKRLFNREFLAARGLALPEWLKLDT